MKSLVRWSATLGLVGAALLGSYATDNLKALALPEAQVLEKLQAVPVYTVVDDKGTPITVSVPNQENKTVNVAGFFISNKDAQDFIEQRVKKSNPELGNKARVAVLTIADVYKLEQENRNKPDMIFKFVPMQQQVQSAQAILTQSGQQGQNFFGTPLFFATGGSERGFLTMEGNGKQVIPMFFEKEQLQQMVDRYKQQQPNQASTVKIEVVPLEGIIENLKTKNDNVLNSIVLWPSRESVEFIRTKLAPAGQNAPQGQQGQQQRR